MLWAIHSNIVLLVFRYYSSFSGGGGGILASRCDAVRGVRFVSFAPTVGRQRPNAAFRHRRNHKV